ncbi:MAG: cupredoxin domain-containing protein [Actinomycetota bacterium]
MKTQERQAGTGEPRGGAGMDWRILSVWTGMAIGVALLVFTALLGEIIPPLIVFALLYGVAVWLTRRGGRAGLIMTAVLSFLFLALNAPFIVPSLSVPASTVDFVMTGLFVVLAISNLVAAIAALRSTSTGVRAALAGRATVALLLVVAAVAVVGRVTYESAPAQSGDIQLTAQNVEFSTEVIEADGGEVSVFVENKDSALHTFTVEELDVDLQVPGGSTARITFDASAGSYEFICVPHASDMKGTLEVK